MELLLQHGADVRDRDHGHITGHGKTPMLSAAQAQQAGAVCWLLEHGADVNEDGGAVIRILSPQAIGAGWSEEHHRAVIHGGQDSDWNDDGWTALMHAANNGSVVLCAALLWRGGDANRRSRHGLCALDLAAQECNAGGDDDAAARAECHHVKHLLVWVGSEASQLMEGFDEMLATPPPPLPREALAYAPTALKECRHTMLLCMLWQGMLSDVVQAVLAQPPMHSRMRPLTLCGCSTDSRFS